MITPFNLPWFVLITLSFSLPFFIARKLEGKSRKEKLFFVKWFSIVSALLWVLYKYLLSIDPNFSFVFWKELPLQPCNTMLWLGIIACILDNETIMSYGYYIGIPCALLALMMPESGFITVSILSNKAIGYYGTHALVVMQGLMFVSLGLCKIDYKSAILSVVFFIFMAFCAHIVNILLRVTVYPEATYYYTFGFDENFLLRVFKRFIPVPLLYMTPIFIASVFVTCLETLIITFLKRMKEVSATNRFVDRAL